MSLMALAVFMGLSARRTKLAAVALSLLVASAVLSTTVNYRLGDPSLVARARWAQRQLELLVRDRAADPAAFRPPLRVLTQDEHKFAAFGAAGLAYTLDMQAKDVVALKAAPVRGRGQMLVVPASGDVYFAPCAKWRGAWAGETGPKSQ